MPVVDASVLISLFLKDDDLALTADWWASQSLAAGDTWHVPNIALAECGAAISRRTQRALLATQIVEYLRDADWIRIHDITGALAGRSAQIAISQRIRGCDAVYVGLARQVAEPLVTFDAEQHERAGPVIEVIRPSRPARGT